MFLSKLVLNIRDRQARCDLARPYELHRTLWRAFPDDDPGRVLFRIDPIEWRCRPSSWFSPTSGPDGSGWTRDRPITCWRLRNSSRFEPSFTPASACASACGPTPPRRSRARRRSNGWPAPGHGEPKTPSARAAARTSRSPGCFTREKQGGFRIPGEWVATDERPPMPNFRVDVIPEGWVRCGKNGHADGRFFAVRFEGVLRGDRSRPVSANRRTRRQSGLRPKAFGFRPALLAPVGGIEPCEPLHELPRFQRPLELPVSRTRPPRPGSHRPDLSQRRRATPPCPSTSSASSCSGRASASRHAAVKALAANNCLLAWVGENGVRLYAHSTGGTFMPAG